MAEIRTQQRALPFSVQEKVKYISLFLIAAIVWLAPIIWAGWTHRRVPIAGKYLNNQYRVACLFTNRANSWSTYYVEIRLKGDRDWIGSDLGKFSQMRPFGYTTRLHRILSKARGDRNEDPVFQSMALWIKSEFESRGAVPSEVEAIRFSMVRAQVGDPDIAAAAGRWQIVPFDQTSQDRRTLLKTVFYRKSEH